MELIADGAHSVKRNQRDHNGKDRSPLHRTHPVCDHSHPDERTDQTADRAADPEACERAHDRTGRNERTDSGNCKHADPG